MKRKTMMNPTTGGGGLGASICESMIEPLSTSSEEEEEGGEKAMSKSSSCNNKNNGIEQSEEETTTSALKRRIRELPVESQALLLTASFLLGTTTTITGAAAGGCCAPWTILKLFVDGVEPSERRAMELAVTPSTCGLVVDPMTTTTMTEEEAEGNESESGGGGGLRFVDESIRMAAYSLIPRKRIDSFHLFIGKRALSGLTTEELDRYTYIVADQLCRGVHLMMKNHHDNDEKMDISKFLLQAGKRAQTESKFKQAGTYLHGGLAVFGGGGSSSSNSSSGKSSSILWKEHYDHALELHNTSAQIQYCLGNHDIVNTLVQRTCANAQSTVDKIPSCEIRIMSLSHGLRRPLEACVFGLDILQELGLLDVPRKPHKCWGVWKEVFRMYWLLRKKTDDELMNMPSTRDRTVIATQTMLTATLGAAFSAAPEMIPLLVSKSLELSLKEGFTPTSGLAFAQYGALYCALGCTEAGPRFGNLALRITEKHDVNNRYTPNAKLVVLGTISPFCQRLHELLDPMLENYALSRQIGCCSDNACYSAVGYVSNAYFCGIPLGTLQTQIERLYGEIGEYHNEMAMTAMRTVRQCTLNLTCRDCKDPGILNLQEEMGWSNQSSFWEFMYDFHAMILAYLFHDYARAFTLSSRCRERQTLSLDNFDTSQCVFYRGLVLIEMIRQSPQSRSKYCKRAKKCIHLVRQWSQHCKANYQHKLRLLEAEWYSLCHKKQSAKKAFREAIQLSAKHEFTNDEALACERAGMFYLRMGKKDVASSYLSRARRSYGKWGAVGKVQHMQDVFGKSCTTTESIII